MTKSFNCPTCSAPLEYKGTPTQECEFCGGTVIASVDRTDRGRIRTVNVSPQAADAAAKIAITSIGGIGAILIISIVLIVGGVGAILYFAFSSVQKAEEAKARSTTQPLVSETGPKDESAKETTELMKIGGEGIGAGRFKDNRHVAIDGQGRIYSSDYSPHKIQVFDSTGKFITQWKPGKGSNLYGLIADKAGNLFVANDKGVFKFVGETGDLLAAVEQISARGVALTWDGKVLVTARKSLMIFDKDLKLHTDIKDAAERASSTFGFDAIAVAGDGSIYVFDRQTGDICKFSPEGKFLNRFPTGTTASHALAVDPKGRIFLSNTSNVIVFDASGKKVNEFDTNQAFGLAFDQAGDLYMATRPYVTKLKLNF